MGKRDQDMEAGEAVLAEPEKPFNRCVWRMMLFIGHTSVAMVYATHKEDKLAVDHTFNVWTSDTDNWTVAAQQDRVLIYGSYTILVHLCEVDGKIPFSSSSMVLVTECTKLGLSIGMFLPEARKEGFTPPSLAFALPYSVPAILYCINNNVAVHMQLQMDPATYQTYHALTMVVLIFAGGSGDIKQLWRIPSR